LNNDASWTTQILLPSADLSIAKSGAPTSPAPGAELTYTITVSNAGPSDATSTVVSDTVPTGTTFQRVVAGTPCSTPAGGVGGLTCQLHTVPAPTSNNAPVGAK